MFSKWNSIYTALTGEEKPAVMLTWLTLLVIVLHINSLLWLARPMTTTPMSKPLTMEVMLLPAPIKKPEIAPIKPKPIEEPKKKPPPKPKPKPKAKPVAMAKPKPTPVQKPKPVVRTMAMDKSVETEPKAESIAPPVPVVETPAPVHQPSVSQHTKAPEQASSAKRHNLAGEAGGTCTPASIHTPRPPYPQSARNRHIEGAGRISFVITAEGHTDQVRLSQSSGHDILDEAALNAVQKWKYATTQPCQASVPFSFKLH